MLVAEERRLRGARLGELPSLDRVGTTYHVSNCTACLYKAGSCFQLTHSITYSSATCHGQSMNNVEDVQAVTTRSGRLV